MNNSFKFKIVSALASSRANNIRNVGLLIPDSWDDWYKYCTLFKLVVFDNRGERHSVGPVKFGEFGLEKVDYYTAQESLPDEFKALPNNYFSLGQDDTYFEALNELGDDYRDHILSALNEISIDDDLYVRSIKESVTKISLLRSVSKLNIKEQYRRLARGEARLTAYNFSYKLVSLKESPDEDSLSNYLQMQLDSCYSRNPNSWNTAMYRALLSSEWLNDQDFQ